METSYPSILRTPKNISIPRTHILDRQFMRRCFAHWKKELTAKQKRCKTRIAGWIVLAYTKDLYENITEIYKTPKHNWHRFVTGSSLHEYDLLEGAHSWLDFSEGGHSLWLTYQIKERLGKYYREKTRLKTQARFLRRAAYHLLHALDWNQTHNKKEN